ncbi:hypothetical protein [Mycoplasma suis]|nr:hypothetical protein [Mycoplasma suis]
MPPPRISSIKENKENTLSVFTDDVEKTNDKEEAPNIMGANK